MEPLAHVPRGGDPLRLHIVAIVLLVAVLPTVPAKAVTIRLPYDSPALLGYQGLADCDAAAGTVCAQIPRGLRLASFRVEDATGLSVGGAWYLHDAAGAFLASGVYCRGAQLDAPPGGTIVVRVEALNSALNCAGSLAGAPSRGVVTLRLE